MMLRQIGPDHMGCKDPDCSSGEFIITADGRVLCADDECFTEYGRLEGSVPAVAAEPDYEPGALYQDSHGGLWRRREGGGWLAWPGGREYGEAAPLRPLIKREETAS